MNIKKKMETGRRLEDCKGNFEILLMILDIQAHLN